MYSRPGTSIGTLIMFFERLKKITRSNHKFLDARIQDESTSISIELRKLMKSIKFEEMSEPDDESDKHI